MKNRFLNMTFTFGPRTPKSIKNMVLDDPKQGQAPEREEDDKMRELLDSIFSYVTQDIRAQERDLRHHMPLRYLYAVNLLPHICHLIMEYGIQMEELAEIDQNAKTDYRRQALNHLVGEIGASMSRGGFADESGTVDVFRDIEGSISFAGINFYPLDKLQEDITIEELGESIEAAQLYCLAAQKLHDSIKNTGTPTFLQLSDMKKKLATLGACLVPIIRK